jgi:hypothetical protein
MEKMNIRQELVEIFGAPQAAQAMLAVETYQEALGPVDDQDLPIFTSEDSKLALEKMGETLRSYGYENTYVFENCIQRWLARRHGVDLSGYSVQRQSYAPVDLGAAFHEGHLYYPVQTLLKTVVTGAGGQIREAERVDIVVVRSDRTLQRIEESVDENGNPSGIYRLSDGTLLQKKPTASAHSTWAWDAIQKYLVRDYAQVPLSSLAIRIHRHLRSRVWLPNDADYWLLTCAAITSYLQPIFDAVPLILLHGQPGTGKSELGAAMTEVSCNAVMIGQSSAPTMMRLMDEARGLVVIDDLESIGVSGGAAGKEKFSEMVQVLKISYKKTSATKIVTNARRKTESMNFYGIKIVSNTKGVDAILGSRMMHISTQNMGPDDLDEFLSRQGLNTQELFDLKNSLHAWAFDHVADVDRVYQQAVAGSTARDEEIAAPLKVIAQLTGIPNALKWLEESLGEQRSKKSSFKTPEQALEYVMEKMATEGARKFTLIEVSLRLRQVLGVSGFNKSSRPLWSKPEWLSRRLRESGWIAEELKRKNLFGYQMKVYAMSDQKRIERGAVGAGKGKPFDFCAGCASCPYRQMHCDILPYRAKREGL